MIPQERLSLMKDGYTQDQVEVIAAGEDAGLDVSVYRDKEFLAIQMEQIRLGLADNLPVWVYAKPEYDWFQMEEIRLGLKDGLDISIFASPEVPYEKMRQLRIGWEQGINLTSYMQYDAGIIREIREAKLASVDILGYVEAGYDEDQVHSIRVALEEGIEIAPYVQIDFRGVEIAEIYKGLKNGLDVSVYAKMEYNWQQMREIRLGLESRVDISYYSDPLYRWQQMREIRLGLEAGLPVILYQSLMYPAPEMAKKRQELLERFEGEEKQFDEQQGIPEEEDIDRLLGDNGLAVTISQKGMYAYLTVVTQKQTFSRKELLSFLESRDVRKGIKEENLQAIMEGRYGTEPILIAQGSIPRKGADGWYEFFFRTDVEKKPRILEDGSVDYQNVEWFETVSAGQKIAYYHEAQDGIDGYLVTGEPIVARKGSEIKQLTGIGFRVDEDKKTYWATVDGMIKLRNTYIEISKKLTLDEITMATGNLDFDGSIVIRGIVGNGVKVKATEDIIIEGAVGAAQIESGGNVILMQGMNSAGKGSIRAAGDINSKFFESVKVYAGGNIQTNNCMNSELYAEGRVEVINAIIGGKVESKKEIRTGEAGNKVGIKTRLEINVSEEAKRQMRLTKEALRKSAVELATLQNAYKDIQGKYAPEVRNAMDIYLKVENAIYTKEKEIRELEETEKGLEDELKSLELARVVVRGYAHEGVSVAFNGLEWKANDLYNITLRMKENRLDLLNN